MSIFQDGLKLLNWDFGPTFSMVLAENYSKECLCTGTCTGKSKL